MEVVARRQGELALLDERPAALGLGAAVGVGELERAHGRGHGEGRRPPQEDARHGRHPAPRAPRGRFVRVSAGGSSKNTRELGRCSPNDPKQSSLQVNIESVELVAARDPAPGNRAVLLEERARGHPSTSTLRGIHVGQELLLVARRRPVKRNAGRPPGINTRRPVNRNAGRPPGIETRRRNPRQRA